MQYIIAPDAFAQTSYANLGVNPVMQIELIMEKIKDKILQGSFNLITEIPINGCSQVIKFLQEIGYDVTFEEGFHVAPEISINICWMNG